MIPPPPKKGRWVAPLSFPSISIWANQVLQSYPYIKSGLLGHVGTSVGSGPMVRFSLFPRSVHILCLPSSALPSLPCVYVSSS